MSIIQNNNSYLVRLMGQEAKHDKPYTIKLARHKYVNYTRK